MVLADFADYRRARQSIKEVWQRKDVWNKMSLINIARSGHFAADRSIGEYAKNIWNIRKI